MNFGSVNIHSLVVQILGCIRVRGSYIPRVKLSINIRWLVYVEPM